MKNIPARHPGVSRGPATWIPAYAGMTMKFYIVVAGLLLGFVPLVRASDASNAAAKPAPAAPAFSSDVATWLTHLEQALTQTTLSGDYQKGDVTQVAAVRGAKQDVAAADLNSPVWKGDFADEDAAELKKERAALAKGVGLLLQGHIDEGRAQILAFEKQYPKSRLLGAAQEALQKITPPAPDVQKAAVAPASTASAPTAPTTPAASGAAQSQSSPSSSSR